jgi:hypothetical protein
MKEISSVVDAFNLLALRREGDSTNVIIRRSAAMLEIIIDVFMAFGFLSFRMYRFWFFYLGFDHMTNRLLKCYK